MIYFTTNAPREATAFSPSPSINFQKKFVAHIARARSPRRPWRRPAAFRLPARPRGRPAAAPGAAQARVEKLLPKLSAPWNLLRIGCDLSVAASSIFPTCFQMFPNVSTRFQTFPIFPNCWEWLGHGKKLLGHGKEMRAGKLTGASGTCSNARLAHAFAHDLWLRRRNIFPQDFSVYFVLEKTEKDSGPEPTAPPRPKVAAPGTGAARPKSPRAACRRAPKLYAPKDAFANKKNVRRSSRIF